MRGTSRRKPWAVLGISFGINLIIGILYIWSVISHQLHADPSKGGLGWSLTQATLPYTLVTIFFVIAMVIFGKIQDTKGPRFTSIIASVLLGVGIILSGIFVNISSDKSFNAIMLVITFGVIAGAGIGTANVSTVPPAIKWFPPEKKGLITGLSVAGIGISAVVYTPIANSLLKSVGVSKTFIYIGIAALILMLVLSQFLVNPPEGYIPPSSGAVNKSVKKTASAPIKDLGLKEVLKTSSFYRLWIMFMFSASAGLMMISQAATIADKVHWSGGIYLVVLLAVFNAAGRIFGGTVSDKIGRINLMRVIFALQAVNMILFCVLYNSIAMLAVGIAVAGLCYGGGFSVFPATTLDLYGTKNFGVNYGLVMTGWGLGGAIGPIIAAAVHDAVGNYNTAYIIAAILLGISFFITFTFRKQKAARS